MQTTQAEVLNQLIGIGIYSPREAERLTGVPAPKICRWLKGHTLGERTYEKLWVPQIKIEDDVFLGFRDLMEVRVVSAFIQAGLSAQLVRRAIHIATSKYGNERPLSTNAFRTDGKNVFLLLSDEEDSSIVDILKSQYAIKRVIEPSFRGITFNSKGEPSQWRISDGVLIDPTRSFGQPVDEKEYVPTSVLANAAKIEGSVAAAARAFRVPLSSVRKAIKFETMMAA